MCICLYIYFIPNFFFVVDIKVLHNTVAGLEFRSEAGTVIIVRKALYGLKSSGAAFRAYLAQTTWDVGFGPDNV